MRVIRKNAEQPAHVWPGGGREDLPDWLAHRVLRYADGTDTLVLKNGVHHVTAAAGDAIVLGADGNLAAWSSQSFAAQFDVVPADGEARTDAPTVEEYVAAGYRAENYPPKGYASRSTPEEIAAAVKAQAPKTPKNDEKGDE